MLLLQADHETPADVCLLFLFFYFSTGGQDQTKALLQKVTKFENEIHTLRARVSEMSTTKNDLEQRVQDLGDQVPLSVTPSSMASVWRSWIKSKMLFVPVLNNVPENVANNICLFHGSEK